MMVHVRHCEGQPGQPLFAVGPFGFVREERANGLSAEAIQGPQTPLWIASLRSQ